jgi:hypothetical protein
MKTYYEIAPQIPIEHKIWVSDGSITVTEQHTVSMLCDRVWQHDGRGFVQIKNRVEEHFEPVTEREQIRLMLSARTLDSDSVQWINDKGFIRVTDPKFFVQTP